MPYIRRCRIRLLGPGGKWQIFDRRGWEPGLVPLFYLNGTQMMAVAIEMDPTFQPGTPQSLFAGGFIPGIGRIAPFDVTADGQRFLMVQEAALTGSEAAPVSITVVQNWFEELRRLVPTD